MLRLNPCDRVGGRGEGNGRQRDGQGGQSAAVKAQDGAADAVEAPIGLTSAHSQRKCRLFFPLFVVIVITRPVVPVMTLRPVLPVVTPLPVVAMLTMSGRVVALFKNRAALSAELRSISP